MFPFNAFSFLEALRNKLRLFPIPCGFPPCAVSRISLVPSKGSFPRQAYHPKILDIPCTLSDMSLPLHWTVFIWF